VLRHGTGCESREGGGCSCEPGFQAQVWSPRDSKTIRKTFRSLSDARAWRAEAQTALRRGTLRAPTRTTLTQAAEEWLSAAGRGLIRTRSGDPYKPSALRSYEQLLRTHVLAHLGSTRLSAVSRAAIQDLIDRMVANGAVASTTRNAVLPLRAIYRRAISRTDVLVNPTEGLALPAVRTSRTRVARADEAEQLIAAVPAGDQAIWATALYAGLRLGELKALHWQDVDLAAGIIHVHRSWDRHTGPIAPKAEPAPAKYGSANPSASDLAKHRLAHHHPHSKLVFARANAQSFTQAITNRARKAWNNARLQPIGLHECRHTYASYMIAAGINAKALSTYMGHSSITTTLARYGHLMPGNERQAAAMLTTYLNHKANHPPTHTRGRTRPTN
jgi:integrase